MFLPQIKFSKTHIKINGYLAAFLAFVFLLMIALIIVWGSKTGVPVYMYHSIIEKPFGSDEGLFVKPNDFEEQVKFIGENGFTSIFDYDLPNSSKFIKPIVITFDDGYEDNYTYAFPILKKYNIKATIFVISGSIGKPKYLTAKQIKEMSDSGLVNIESHTESHIDLSSCTEEKIDSEFSSSNQTLESITDKKVKTVAYPYGKRNRTVIKEASKFYSLAFITFGSKNYKTSLKYETPRAGIFRNTGLNEFKTITYERSRSRFKNISERINEILK